MSQYSHAIQKYNDIGIKDQPFKIKRGGTQLTSTNVKLFK
jgi:hypothetical protein